MKKIPVFLIIGLASVLIFSSTNLSYVYAANSEQTSSTEVTSTNDSTDIIHIPDSYLKEAIAHALGVPPSSNITISQLKSLTYLQAGYVTSLEGLEYATNLKELVLYEGKVSDISPLANLTSLKELDLSSNLISDLSPLMNLKNLTHLYLGENNITNILPLANLTNLEELYLSHNHISNLVALSELNHLRYLYLGENDISTISFLANLTNLEVLALGGNHISNTSYLSRLTNLVYLSLYRNNISDVSALATLTNLEELYVSDNDILKFSPLRSLANLNYLEQNNNPGTDTVKPTIEGVTNKTLIVNQNFDPTLGVKATDNADGNVTKYINIDGIVDTTEAKTYILIYTVADSVGNQTKVKRTITIKKDKVKPTLSGIGNKTLHRNTIFNATAGVKANDNIDGNITNDLKITGTVNMKKAGKYTLTYTITDSSGNKTMKKRVIIVK